MNEINDFGCEHNYSQRQSFFFFLNMFKVPPMALSYGIYIFENVFCKSGRSTQTVVDMLYSLTVPCDKSFILATSKPELYSLETRYL